MNTEDVIAYVTRETTPERVMYFVSVLLVLAFMYSMWMQWKLNAPKREQAKMDREREKANCTMAARHIFGALQYAVKDGDLPADFTAHLVKRLSNVLPELVPNGATLKDELLEKKGEIATKASSVLSLMRLKLS